MPKRRSSHNESVDTGDSRVCKRRKGPKATSIYQPLDSANLEIRLLHVNTRSTDSAGRIKCRLERVTIRQTLFPPIYEAISWCWGDPTPAKEIILNGVPRKISANAEQVLRRLCFEQGHAVVWLDAVCIDQSNIQERGEQVAIMKEVYPRAERTLLWLGEDDDRSAQSALESIDKILLQCREETNNHRSLDDTFWDSQGDLLFSDRQLPQCDWEALEVFFSTSLFTRLWVIQEIILSKNVRCFRGRYSKSWADIFLAAQWLYHCKYWRRDYMGHNVKGIENTAFIWQLAQLKPSLCNFLFTSVDFHTSLPLDKVYGLLGLVKKSVSEALELTPDYTARVDVVYTAATRLAIDELAGKPHRLDLLSLAQLLVPPGGDKSDECDQTPSWVPRYDRKYDSLRSPTDVKFFGVGAANGLPAIVREYDPNYPRLLSAKGVLVSHVAWQSNLLSGAMLAKGGDVHALAEELLSCISAAQKRGHGDEAIAVALTARRSAISNDALVDEEFLETYRNCTEWCEAVTGQEEKQDSSSSTVPEAVLKYRDALWHGSRNHLFFTTESGHIGSGPPSMEVNDAVCILLGCTVPMVLREEKSGRWRLLGEAYMHDIMEVGTCNRHGCEAVLLGEAANVEYRVSTSNISKIKVAWKRRRDDSTLNDEYISFSSNPCETKRIRLGLKLTSRRRTSSVTGCSVSESMPSVLPAVASLRWPAS